jgi:hypothetical protein
VRIVEWAAEMWFSSGDPGSVAVTAVDRDLESELAAVFPPENRRTPNGVDVPTISALAHEESPDGRYALAWAIAASPSGRCTVIDVLCAKYVQRWFRLHTGKPGTLPAWYPLAYDFVGDAADVGAPANDLGVATLRGRAPDDAERVAIDWADQEHYVWPKSGWFMFAGWNTSRGDAPPIATGWVDASGTERSFTLTR